MPERSALARKQRTAWIIAGVVLLILIAFALGWGLATAKHWEGFFGPALTPNSDGGLRPGE